MVIITICPMHFMICIFPGAKLICFVALMEYIFCFFVSILCCPSCGIFWWKLLKRANYDQTPITDSCLIWTPHYYRQFALSLGKESPKNYIFSNFNPLNTDTPLVRMLSMAPLVSILMGCGCTLAKCFFLTLLMC